MVHVIVEGETDRLFLEALLQDLVSEHPLSVEPAGGKDAARLVARRWLVLEGEPVVLVFDTDSSDVEAAEEAVASLRSYFEIMAPGRPLHLAPMTPSLEVLLADHPRHLEQRLGRSLSADELLAARLAPKGFLQAHLQDLGAASIRDLLCNWTESDLEVLRQDERIASLRRFITEHTVASDAHAA